MIIRSIAEVELRLLAHGVCELLSLKLVLQELQINIVGPIKLYCDKKTAISSSLNPFHCDRTEHVEVDRYFIKKS